MLIKFLKMSLLKLNILFIWAGVNFVGLEGAEKDKVVVIGDGIDAAKLATSLRKKVGQTDIISVGDVKKN